jgi:hypothetical protein
MAFGYELLRVLGASAAADALQEGMRYNQLMERA